MIYDDNDKNLAEHRIKQTHYCSVCGKAISRRYFERSEKTGELLCKECKRKEIENNNVYIEGCEDE